MGYVFQASAVAVLGLTLGGCSLQEKTGGGEDEAKRETLFSPKPYVERCNTKVGMQYDLIRNEMAKPNSELKWRKGKHKLLVKGREEGARLERLFIGKTGAEPEKGAGITLKAESGAIVGPMRLETMNGVKTLIGGKDAGTAAYEVEVDADGDYSVWGKACGPDEKSNSFFVVVDGRPEMLWGVPVSLDGKAEWTEMKDRGLEHYFSWSFWLTWGATSPLSQRRDDPELRKAALFLTDKKLDQISLNAALDANGQALWFIRDLETVCMWQQDPRTPRPAVAGMLKKIRPFVDNCQALALKGNGWVDNTPNILLQQAALLRLASAMWRDEDPRAAGKWAATSEERLSRALNMKMPGGTFCYSYGSGADAAYFNYDGNFLTRYYLLTGDARARAALKDMAVAAAGATSHGQPTSMGSPWWKHVFHAYNHSGAIPEAVLAVSQDPAYARLVELGRKRLFNAAAMSAAYDAYDGEVGVYYNMLLPEFSSRIAPLENKCFFSEMENGPALRHDGLNVAMPWRSWSETTCGATWSTPDAVASEVCSVILTALTRDTAGRIAKARYPIAYSVAEHLKPIPDVRAVVVGNGFIASATSFRPALGGPALPGHAYTENESPWQRTDIYFADKNGFAGSLELKALRDNECSKVALWAHVSDNMKIAGSAIKLEGLTVEFEAEHSGKIVNLGKIWGPPGGYYPIDLLESTLKEAGPEGFKKGDAFHAAVAVNVDGARGLKIGACDVKDDLYSVEVLLGGEHRALLLFNASKQTKPLPRDKQAQTVIELPPGSLTILP